jgi:hypothetical protein
MRFLAVLFIVAALAGLWAGAAAAGPGDSLAACATCHAGAAQEWAASTHAAAGQSDVFLRLVAAGRAMPTDWSKEGCLRCHSPLRESDAAALSGIPCQVCHGIASVDGIGNGAFRLASDGILRGATASQTPHITLALDALTESRFCAACHEQFHPVTGVPLQTTYSEWLNSPAAAAGNSCQDCHMRGGAGVGHAMGASASDAAAKAGALARAISLDVQSPETATAGRHVVVEVALQNEGAGHALPTGKNEGGEMWLEFAASGADGTVLYQERLSYGVVYDDAEGKHDVPLTLWDAARIFADRRLQPGRALAEQFAFAVPVEMRGDIRVNVALMYRAAPAWLTENLSLPAVDAFPVHRASATLRVLEPPPAPTYVLPTPVPTPLPLPTVYNGTGVRAEAQDWVMPVLIAGGVLLVIVALWAVRRRAV